MDTSNNIACIISIGMRCFTEMYLKEMNLKKFSGPFDGIYSTNINNIIDLMKNKINYDKLIHSETINNTIIQQLNGKHGNRSMYKNYFDENNLELSYHNATFPHHNLNNHSTKLHFDKCFQRLDIIKNKKIRTLFCLFIHPEYSTDREPPLSDILKLNTYLNEEYNCHLLIITFKKINSNEKYITISKTDTYTNIIVNNNTYTFSNFDNYLKNDFFECLKEIFNSFEIKQENLLKYEDIIHYSEIVTYRNLQIDDKINYLNLIKNFRPINEEITTNEFNYIYKNILSHGNIIVAELNDKIIGTITILLEKKFINNSSIYAHIEDVFIDESYRNKSIGSNLIKKAIDYCKEKNVFKISLNCHENLKDFYEKNNFEKRQINMSQLL